MWLTFVAHIMFPLDSVGLASLRLWLNRKFGVRLVDMAEANTREQVLATAGATCSGDRMLPKAWQPIS